MVDTSLSAKVGLKGCRCYEITKVDKQRFEKFGIEFFLPLSASPR